MDKKQTAVQFMINSLPQIDWEHPHYGQLLQHVLEMEKEQILDAYGVVETTEQGDIMNAEQYYNETYNSKQ